MGKRDEPLGDVNARSFPLYFLPAQSNEKESEKGNVMAQYHSTTRD
jgi:hypothetical protein